MAIPANNLPEESLDNFLIPEELMQKLDKIYPGISDAYEKGSNNPNINLLIDNISKALEFKNSPRFKQFTPEQRQIEVSKFPLSPDAKRVIFEVDEFEDFVYKMEEEANTKALPGLTDAELNVLKEREELMNQTLTPETSSKLAEINKKVRDILPFL
ncbi:hypothetical protein GF376_00935 [Candidatus Peregrinibacteria bacterium]|nr:hypothetical protein [Candidatus Peregrinibacteria bacterium]